MTSEQDMIPICAKCSLWPCAPKLRGKGLGKLCSQCRDAPKNTTSTTAQLEQNIQAIEARLRDIEVAVFVQAWLAGSGRNVHFIIEEDS